MIYLTRGHGKYRKFALKFSFWYNAAFKALDRIEPFLNLIYP